MKRLRYLLALTYLFLFSNFAIALDGTVEYNAVNIDYSTLNANKYVTKGNTLLNRAETEKNITKERKNALYAEALGSYIAATEINPKLISIYGKIGYIYGKINKLSLAKSYLNKGLNMDIKNPEINYYYGIVSFDAENYNNALKYYKRAEKCKFHDTYDINFKIGETNEKLGDLTKARIAYAKALSAKPNDTKARARIKIIDDLKYNNSQYYFRKKSYYYD